MTALVMEFIVLKNKEMIVHKRPNESNFDQVHKNSDRRLLKHKSGYYSVMESNDCVHFGYNYELAYKFYSKGNV